ncbi:MAG: chorismate synthase [Spirochaetota bacterium]
MTGSTFGRMITITTFGESHGVAIGVVIDGIQAGFPLDLGLIQKEMDRRKPGQSKVTTSRGESDTVQILSGLFEGKTTGTPLAILIPNSDQHSSDYDNLRDVYRPGHADFTYDQKYGFRDHRGGGRSSGRETAARTAAGAVAKQILNTIGITVTAYTLEAAGIACEHIDYQTIDSNVMRAPDREAAKRMEEAVQSASEQGDSVGGIVECIATGVPAGLGDPVFEKLDARISHGIVSLGAVKGIEFGIGFRAARLRGSEHNDQFIDNAWTNHAGGILGGISTGEDILFRCVIKPTASISKAQKALNIHNEPVDLEIAGRHDPCICPRIVPVIESMTALTLLDAYYAQFGRIYL